MRNLTMHIMLVVLMSMASTKAFAYDIAVQNADGKTIYYNYINNGMELEVTYRNNDYNSYLGDIVIPEAVTYMNRTRKVTSIGSNAFYGCKYLTSVTIPNNVTSICGWAFQNCSKLISVTISNGVTSIGVCSFKGCSSLISLIIPNSVTSIGNSSFSGCSGLTMVTLPNSITTISDNLFSGCSCLTSVTIPNSVTSIGEYNQEIKGETNVEIIPVIA